MTENRIQEHGQLIALTQLCLLQEYPEEKYVHASQENWHFFKADAAKLRANASVIPQMEKPTPPLSPQPIISSQPIVLSQPKISPPLNLQTTPPAPAEQPAISLQNPPEPQKKGEAPLFKLEPLPFPEKESLDDLKKICKEKFPQYQLLDHPPVDDEAKALLQLWKKKETHSEVIILSFDESPIQKAFLQNIAKAIRIRLGSAVIVNARKVEADHQWEPLLNSDKLRLVIASDYAIYGLKQLMSYYKEDAGSIRKLKDAPLLLLSDLSLYLKEPKLKPSLWKAICEVLK